MYEGRPGRKLSGLLYLGILLALGGLSACGGGGGAGGTSGSGGSGGSGSTAQPYIAATVISFPAGASSTGFVAANYNTDVGVEVLEQSSSGTPITSATVSVNGTALTYVAADKEYEGQLNLAPGGQVTLTVDVGSATYSAAHAQFTTFPTITTPASGATWSAVSPNVVSWSGVVPDTSSTYVLGVFGTDGSLVWPTGGTVQAVSASQTSYTIPANSISAGNRVVLAGIADVAQIAGAAADSGLLVGSFGYVTISVSATSETVQSLAITPATLTLAPGKSTQLAATATHSDGSTQDETAQVTWGSSDTSKVTVSATGVATGVAVGSATVTASYEGFSASSTATVFQPNPSPQPPLSESVAYQIDYAHSGMATVGSSGPTFPPTAHWALTLNGDVSYPIIAGGEVFVTTDANSSGAMYGTSLYAIDETTGSIAWGPLSLSGTYGFSAVAYDHGTLFVVNFDGLLRTFDGATGTPGWSEQLSSVGDVTSPPTAVNGIVYVLGEDGATALDETDGTVLWTAPAAADHSSPAVSPDGVFEAGPCDVYEFDPIVGTALWHYSAGCFGGGGKTPAYADNAVYARQLGSTDANDIFDAATGSIIGTFQHSLIPAFSGTRGFFQESGTLEAIDQSSGDTLWTFTGDGQLVTAPIVIDNVVVVGSASGTVYALNVSDGSVLWTGSAGAPIAGPDEQNATVTTGLGAGDGYLVVPAGTVLNGWRVIP